MNPYELFALDFYLSDYPEDMTFDEVLVLVEEEDEAVEHLADYEAFCGGYLAHQIDSLAAALEADFMYLGDDRAAH